MKVIACNCTLYIKVPDNFSGSADYEAENVAELIEESVDGICLSIGDAELRES